mmetsp:Transcript_23881/g.57581  ORF Transcript_23881/g.57581 Transcript_23881/m.57581 type:complete len:332 (+) Transcript_23881:147-1142(+)
MTTHVAAIVGLCICCLIALLHLPGAHGFAQPRNSQQTAKYQPSPTPPSSTSLHVFKWPTLPSLSYPIKTEKSASIGERNGLDSDYPWRFEGRFIFRPSLVRISNEVQPQSANLLSLFGYSLGGSVVLEYDISPVGPYREYVTMGGVVSLGKVDVGEPGSMDERRLGLGQWGTNLYVSTQVAEDVCQYVWGVPAQVADIDFVQTGDNLADKFDVGRNSRGQPKFTLSGWKNTCIVESDETSQRYGNIPIFWTPTIKALWAPFLFQFGKQSANEKQLLPLHKLRLSASALRLKRCQRFQSEGESAGGEIPLGVALVVDNVLIEIGERLVSSNL